MIRSCSILLAGSAALAAILSGCAAQRVQLNDRLAVGRDAAGYRCSAFRVWPKPETAGQSYNLVCGGAVASRTQGTIAVTPSGSPAAADGDCGPAGQAALDGIGPVEVRRCQDKALGGSVVEVRFVRGKDHYRAAALGPALAPLERALAVLVSGDASKGDVASAAQIRIEGLSGPADVVGGATGVAIADPDVALRAGIALNQQSLFVEASRVLNDAIAQGGDVGPATLIELQLEAGLADSNLQLSAAAAEHYARAEALLASTPTLDRRPLLTRKLATYRVLDQLNRRDYAAVLREAPVVQGAPTTAAALFASPVELTDGARPRNGRRARLEATVGNRDAEIARYLALDAQSSWAKSVALLAATGDSDKAEEALKIAADQIRAVLRLNQGRVDPSPFIYLIAQIERQGGRIDAYRATSLGAGGQQARYRRAVDRFDCARRALIGQAPPVGAPCLVGLDAPIRAIASPVSPILAETEIERASLLGRAGASTETILADFRTGIDDLVASGRDGSLAPAGLEVYLDLLADRARGDPKSPAAAEFFRAVQAIGSPAIARQYAQLKTLANASGPQGALLRERADLLRELPALRYQIEAIDGIKDVTAEVAQRRADLVARRDAGARRLGVIEDQLLASNALNPVDDSPIELDKLSERLRPGEIYFKVAEVRGALFGLVVGRDTVAVYRIAKSAREVAGLTDFLRQSIRDGTGNLPQFNVSAANLIFKLITGPAQAQVAGASSIVYNPSGPLAGLPLGVLVTDQASGDRYRAAARAAPDDARIVQDYSQVAFLGSRADVSLALSPRSFIESRKLAPSSAAQPFLGIGDPVVGNETGGAMLRFGADCLIPRSQIIVMARAADRIGPEKLTNAATAFGVPAAPQITGAAFTDLDIERRGAPGGELGQYQVIHFATHGAPEYVYKCALVPPALLTTVGGEGSDGMLSIEEVARLDLNANLVVLSACDTAASTGDVNGRLLGGSEEKSGTSLEGLVRSFLAAHARAVMATYWNVSSGSESDELFRVFYATGRTASIGDSLKAAQVTLIRSGRYSHPYYWGAYFVVGDASKTMRSTPATAMR